MLCTCKELKYLEVSINSLYYADRHLKDSKLKNFAINKRQIIEKIYKKLADGKPEHFWSPDSIVVAMTSWEQQI